MGDLLNLSSHICAPPGQMGQGRGGTGVALVSWEHVGPACAAFFFFSAARLVGS